MPFWKKDALPTSAKWVHGELDFLKPAAEVLKKSPETYGLNKRRLAELCAMSYNGQRIKVAEYPPDQPREEIQALIRRTRRWAEWPIRYAQKLRTQSAFPNHTLRVRPNCCQEAERISQTETSTKKLKRLPLDKCRVTECQCSWELVMKHKSRR